MSQYKLTNGILKLSVSKVWDTASLEWKLNEIYEAVNPETCLCGHFPIVEICILKNNLNNESVTVGNCCVKKFLPPRRSHERLDLFLFRPRPHRCRPRN